MFLNKIFNLFPYPELTLNKMDEIVLQYSKDGNLWSKDKMADARFVRVINLGQEEKSAKINLFEVIFD